MIACQRPVSDRLDRRRFVGLRGGELAGEG